MSRHCRNAFWLTPLGRLRFAAERTLWQCPAPLPQEPPAGDEPDCHLVRVETGHFVADRAKNPIAITMIADELSEQDMHGPGVETRAGSERTPIHPRRAGLGRGLAAP